MVFTSWAFLFFFAFFLVGMRLLPNRASRQVWLLAASVYFYASWNPIYILLIAAPSVVDYWCALQISQTEEPRARRLYVLVSVFTNLSLLAYFKYTNFFLSTAAALHGQPFAPLAIVLPVGISFFTFKALSYTIDVYRREIPVCRSWWQFAMFITYFPELVAGPIVRASVFLPQMRRSLRFSWTRTLLGLQIILLGVTKKIVFADRFAVLADGVFNQPSLYSPFTVMCGVVAYSLQIYCDFSGYSDIAIGVSRIIGYDLPENFNMPYLSLGLSEFWRRWHITLSSWLRDYLYIPLGGNRGGELKTYRNLTITMLLGGLWHGASWTFVVWGALHGAGLAVERMATRGKRAKGPLPRWQTVVRWLATYSFVCLCWIFFRAESFTKAIIVLRKVCWLDQGGVQYFYLPLFLLLPFVVLGHVLGVSAARQERLAGTRPIRPPSWLAPLYEGVRGRFAVKPHRWAGLYVLLPRQPFMESFVTALWLIGIWLFASLNTSPFIYFQF